MKINQGDIIIINAEPHSGMEMGGHNRQHIRRPMLVLSNNYYNHNPYMSLLIGMPITSVDHHDPTKYFKLTPNLLINNNVHGYVVMWQMQNFDYNTRHGKVVDHLRGIESIKSLSQAGKDMIDVI